MSIELLSFVGFLSAASMLLIAVWIDQSTNDKRPPGSG
jgi:hypothetical protein